MRPHASVRLLAVVALLSALTSAGAAHAGRLGILSDVHGYDTRKGVLVPVRGVSEWLGATVDFVPPRITVCLNTLQVAMELGSSVAYINGREVRLDLAPREYGGITCAPLRFLGEALGVEVDYFEKGPLWERIGCGPIVVLTSGTQRGIILVHRAPPDAVASIVSNLAVKGRFPDDFVMAVLAHEGRYAYATEPRFWVADSPAAPDGAYLETLSGEGADVILVFSEGKWRTAWFPGGMTVEPSSLARAGVPAAIARRLGVPIKGY